MSLKLHHWYSPREAIAAFGDEERAERFCDGQFVVLPTAVLAFVSVGPTIDESHVSSPSEVVWRPGLPIPSVGDYAWLPEKVRDVYDRSGPQVRKIRDHHLFLQAPTGDQFFYAGDAHLGSYGSLPLADGVYGLGATFSLCHKLPRAVWLELGGYPGWEVEVNHECHRIDAEDSAGFEQLAGELLTREFSHLSMTRYEQDSLTVHTNAHRGWLMYLRTPDDGGLYVRDPTAAGPSDTDEVFRCVCGIDLEFPAASTVPRELAVQAALEFFQIGRLPACVHWEMD